MTPKALSREEFIEKLEVENKYLKADNLWLKTSVVIITIINFIFVFAKLLKLIY